MEEFDYQSWIVDVREFLHLWSTPVGTKKSFVASPIWESDNIHLPTAFSEIAGGVPFSLKENHPSLECTKSTTITTTTTTTTTTRKNRNSCFPRSSQRINVSKHKNRRQPRSHENSKGINICLWIVLPWLDREEHLSDTGFFLLAPDSAHKEPNKKKRPKITKKRRVPIPRFILNIFTLRKDTFPPSQKRVLKKTNRPFTKYHVARHRAPHHSRTLRVPSIAMSPPLRSSLPVSLQSSAMRSATNRSQPLWRKALVSQSATVSLRECCYSLSPGCWLWFFLFGKTNFGQRKNWLPWKMMGNNKNVFPSQRRYSNEVMNGRMAYVCLPSI